MDKRLCNEKLKNYRDEIDRIDNEILRLLNERAKIAKAVGDVKKECNLPIFNP
ncbi:MAG: chorismate mutase, partial [Persephonella sp.]